MPSIPAVQILKTTLLTLIFSAAVIGCSKKEQQPAAATPVADSGADASTNAAGTAVPVLTDINPSLAEVDASLKANDYAKAVQTMLVVQNQKQLSDEQSQEARAKMSGLQRSLSAAIASGDPNARAAGEALRQAAMQEKLKK